MDNLSLYWKILDSFPNFLDCFIINNSLLNFLWNILDLGLNCIVVGDGPLDWHSLGSDDFLVLHDFSFDGDPFDSFDGVVFDVLGLEWDVFDSGLNWNLFGNSSMSNSTSDNWSTGHNWSRCYY